MEISGGNICKLTAATKVTTDQVRGLDSLLNSTNSALGLQSKTP
jgi:hypothetical protein